MGYKITFFRDEFMECLNEEKVVARSVLERRHIQHYDKEDNKIGRTEFGLGFFGNLKIEHFDKDGNKIGKSIKKEIPSWVPDTIYIERSKKE